MSKIFKSLYDIEKYIQNNAASIALTSGKPIGDVMKSEAERLKKILVKHVGLHYTSWEPNSYERTFGLINSIRLETLKQSNNELSIRIYFDPSEATHPSVVKGGEPGFTPILIDQGYKDKSHKTPHFQGYRGSRFIQSAIMEFQNTSPYGFNITVHYEPTTGDSWDVDYQGG